MDAPHITSIHVYPVKSCAGIDVTKALCDNFGLQYDREWLIIKTDGTPVTQRDRPKMALIQPSVENGMLTLEVADRSPLVVKNCEQPQIRCVNVWGNECAGFDEGDEAASWLSAVLQMDCRLIRYDPDCRRLTEPSGPEGSTSRIMFADAFPLLVISEESLQNLNARLTDPIPMNRFRPSIVIQGLGEFAEDRASALTTECITLHSTEPCARCVITTIGQEDGVEKGPEPLRTLSQYRRDGKKVLFGQYFMSDTGGFLSVGDRITARF